MTYKETIQQAEHFTNKQRQQIGYYFLYPTLKKEEKKKFNQLLNIELDLKKETDDEINLSIVDFLKYLGIDISDEEIQRTRTKNTLDNFMKSKGILKNKDLSDITEEKLYLQEEKENEVNPYIANLLKSKGILKGIDTSDISDEELHLQED